MDLPGSVGWHVIGDKSIEFYRNPVNFCKKNIKHYDSPLFLTRFLNKPTVFVCSNFGVQQVLSDCNNSYKMGYKAFMGDIFGENILFTDEKWDASVFRGCLSHLFTKEAMKSYYSVIERVAAKHISTIESQKSLCLYKFFKKMVSEVCLSLFLGLNFDDAVEAERIVSLTVEHWRGIISLPVQLHLPGSAYESDFKKAMKAKKSLLMVIQEQRVKGDGGFIGRLQDAALSYGDSFIDNHLLLFISALLPKAISSILTSFAIELGSADKVDLQRLLLKDLELRSDFLKEVFRLHPPFIGGRRIVEKEVLIDGYRVPKGYAVVFMIGAAHRDSSIFQHPDTFQYERWRQADGNISEKNLFTFGYGPRKCLGQGIATKIINEIIAQFMSAYTWTLEDGHNIEMKLLPVTRPVGSVFVRLQAADECNNRNSASSQAGPSTLTQLH